jgi:hypothetical protein
MISAYLVSVRLDGSKLRQASDAPTLQFRARHVTLVRITPDGSITQAKGVGEKKAMVDAVGPDDCVLVAWTGQHSTDVFFLDDRSLLAEALAGT